MGVSTLLLSWPLRCSCGMQNMPQIVPTENIPSYLATSLSYAHWLLHCSVIAGTSEIIATVDVTEQLKGSKAK